MKGPYRPCFEKECILELTWTMCGPKENLPFMALLITSLKERCCAQMLSG